MTLRSDTVQSLLVRIQAAFLDDPGLQLTLAGAVRRFQRDAVTCAAILDVLADVGVLARTPAGAYVRRQPSPAFTRASSTYPGATNHASTAA